MEVQIEEKILNAKINTEEKIIQLIIENDTKQLDVNITDYNDTEIKKEIAQNKSDIEELNKKKVNTSDLGNELSQYVEEHKSELQGPEGPKGDKGEPGENGKDGIDGYTPVKGTDYYTDEDKQEIEKEIESNFEKNGYVKDTSYTHTDNNFTNEEKNKLNDLQNYDDTEIKQELLNKTDKEVVENIRADLGIFTTVTEDLHCELSNNYSSGRFDGSVGEEISNISTSAFSCFRLDVDEGKSYYFKYRHANSNVGYIRFTDENDIILQIADADEEYTEAGVAEKTYIAPKGAKKVYFTTYYSLSNFMKNPRLYSEFKVTYKEVAKEYIDKIYNGYAKVKPLDLSDYLITTTPFKPHDVLEVGIYQITGKGALGVDGGTTFDKGDIIFVADGGDAISVICGALGGAYYYYNSETDDYEGGYYCNLTDVQDEVSSTIKGTVSYSTAKLTKLTVDDNRHYRRPHASGSTAVTLSPSTNIKNLSTTATAKWDVWFKTHATTSCTFTWNDTSSTAYYIVNGVQVATFEPELDTYYNIDAEWKGTFWLFNITGFKEVSE